MYNLARKDMMGRHLSRMNKLLPFDFNFFPNTYCMPHDYKYFMEESDGRRTYIVKPENQAQGRGIFLTQDPKQIDGNSNMVI